MVINRLTVFVTPLMGLRNAGAGADSAWEQKKMLEARRMPVNAIDSPNIKSILCWATSGTW